jgi:tetratricopeptide (TPR) repeat protein
MFQNAEYENSSVLANKSRAIFEKSGDWAGVTKADRLIKNLDMMLFKLNESNGYYQKGQGFMKVADYENATLYILKAREIYSNISRVKDVANCDARLAEITSGNSTKGKADAYFAEARQYFESRDYGTAQQKAEAAKELYRKINDAEGVAKAEALIKSIPPANPFNNLFIIAVIVLGFIGLIIFNWTRTKTRRETRERTEVEDKKRQDEERRLAELEAERKMREEEKARMMLERKRLKEMLEQEKKAIKGGGSEQRNSAGEDGSGLRPAADRSQIENERAMLEKMLGEERETLKKERAVISEQLGLRQSKAGAKHDEPAPESAEAISDRERIKEMVDNTANHEQGEQKSTDSLDEIERLRELIKKEREGMKKGP